MQVFIFPHLEQVSGNYHTNGGAVIIAENDEKARQLAEQTDGLQISESEWQTAEVFTISGDAPPKVYIYPDAGCC